MLNTTYTLEDNGSWNTPAAQRPQICEDCFDVLFPIGQGRVRYTSVHAAKRSQFHFTHLDYLGWSTDECWCCHTRKYNDRHLVEVTPKAVAA